MTNAGAIPVAPLREASWARRQVAKLRPRAWMGRVPGPVFQKEVWSINKRLSTSWLRLAYGATLLGIVALTFISIYFQAQGARFTPGGYRSSTAATLQQYQTMAPVITVTIAWTQFVLLALVACALGAPAIADERRAGTLGTLLSTPVTAWQIVLGKLLSRMLELTILMLLSAPLLLAIRAFGGVPGWYILAVYTLTFTTALVGAQLAIFLSIKAKRAGGAFMSAVTVLGALLVGIPLLVFIALIFATGLVNAPGGPPAWVQWIFVPSSPGVMLFLSTEVLSPDAPFSNWGSRTWIPCVLSLLGLWFLLFTLSSVRLRSVMMTDAGGGRTAKPAKAPKPALAPKGAAAATPAPILTTQDAAEAPQAKSKRRASRVREGLSREVGDPAVLWRERELRLWKMGPWTRRVTATVIVLAVLALYWFTTMHQGVAISLAMVGVLAILLNAAGVNASSIAGEREGRTLGVLLASPLSSSDLVRQKFLGGFLRLWPLWAVVLIHLLAFNFSYPLSLVLRQVDLLIPTAVQQNLYRDLNWVGAQSSIWTIPMFIATLAPPVAMLCASGVFFSTITRNSTRASVFNVLLALALWVAGPALMGITMSFTGRIDPLTIAVLWPNPFVLTASPLLELIKGRDQNADLFTYRFELPESSGHSFIEMWIVIIVIAALYAGATALFLRLAAARLRTRSGV
jgi:ABC-type transport system involved in multi-copper enzyme maturation permease subunit